MHTRPAKITAQSAPKKLATSAAILLLSTFLISSMPVFAQKRPTSVDYPNRTKKIEDLPNFHSVHPFLYRGGEPTKKGMKQLQEKGVKTVIDLRAKSASTNAEEAIAHELGMRYINLPMSDKAPTEAQLTTYMKTVDEAKSNNAPVFLHCAHGSDRTGCLVGIWRVSRDDYSYNDAYKEMRKYWFGPQFKKLSAAVQKRSTH
jgi:protein-tyrosine phosphatase